MSALRKTAPLTTSAQQQISESTFLRSNVFYLYDDHPSAFVHLVELGALTQARHLVETYGEVIISREVIEYSIGLIERLYRTPEPSNSTKLHSEILSVVRMMSLMKSLSHDQDGKMASREWFEAVQDNPREFREHYDYDYLSEQLTNFMEINMRQDNYGYWFWCRLRHWFLAMCHIIVYEHPVMLAMGNIYHERSVYKFYSRAHNSSMTPGIF
jgi:hypothetical protein